MKRQNNIALIIAAHDGLVSMCTGVGVVVHSFIEAFDDISEKSEFIKNNNVDLFCLAPLLRKDSSDFRKEIRETTRQTCLNHGGKLVDIPTLSDGSSQGSVWGGADQWLSASSSTASYIKDISKKYEKVIVIAHDTIFASIRRFAQLCHNLQVIWIPHSLGYVFHDEFTDKKRISLEKKAIEAMQKSKNDIIGYIGNASREVLQNDYHIKEDRLIPFINGVYRNLNMFDVSEKEAVNFLKKQGIPGNKKIILAWGRCTYQKAYDILIPGFNKFVRAHPEYHLIAIMPTETSQENYIQKIKKEIKKLPEGSITPIFNFEKTLPASILQIKNLEIAVFPARFEGAPLTPLEALLFARDKTRFIYSNIPPHQNIFQFNNGAITFDEFTPDAIYRSLTKSLNTEGIAKEKRIVPDFVRNMARGIDKALMNHA